MEESTAIENIQGLIRECQKKIQMNYSILHSEDLEEKVSKALIEEISSQREKVLGYQANLKNLYKELFSGSRKLKSQVIL
jgi:hypothetical protein